LPPAPKRTRREIWDSRVSGFGIRISDVEDPDPNRRGKAGKITFILFARFSPGAAPTRRNIGVYGATSLDAARSTAGEWRSLIAKGIDPKVIEAEAQEAAARERALRVKHSFANVAQAFFTSKLALERRGREAERDFRAAFVTAWGDRPVSDITPLDVLEIINAKKRTAPVMARALLVMARRFFSWPAQGGEDHRHNAVANPTPQRRGAVRTLARHRPHEIPTRPALPHASAHRTSA